MKDSDYGYNTILNSQPSCKTTKSACKYDKAKVQQHIVGYVNIREGDEKAQLARSPRVKASFIQTVPHWQDLMNAVGQRPVSVAIDAVSSPNCNPSPNPDKVLSEICPISKLSEP